MCTCWCTITIDIIDARLRSPHKSLTRSVDTNIKMKTRSLIFCFSQTFDKLLMTIIFVWKVHCTIKNECILSVEKYVTITKTPVKIYDNVSFSLSLYYQDRSIWRSKFMWLYARRHRPFALYISWFSRRIDCTADDRVSFANTALSIKLRQHRKNNHFFILSMFVFSRKLTNAL